MSKGLKRLQGNKRLGWHLLAIVVFAVAGSALILLSFAARPDNSPRPSTLPEVAAPGQSKKTGQLRMQGSQLQIAAMDLRQHPGKKDSVVPKAKALAEERKSDLLEVIKINPKLARSLVLSPSASEALENAGLPVEKHVTLTGAYGFKQVDDQAGDRIDYLLTTADGKDYILHDTNPLPQVPFGSTLRIRGYVLDDRLLIDAPAGTEEPSQVAYASGAAEDTGATSTDPVSVTSTESGFPTTGALKVGVVFGNFTGGSGTVDIAKYKALYNGTPGADVSSWLTENSKGKASEAFDFYDAGTNTSIPCSDIAAQMTAMRNALLGANPGVPYRTYIYLTNCSPTGFAGKTGTSPTYVYIANRYDLFAHIHEFAHTMGSSSLIGHGAYHHCTPHTFISPFTWSFDEKQCVSLEYSDPYDVLGATVKHMNAVHKLAANWLDSAQVATVTTQGTSRFTLAPYATGNGLVALKIPRGNSGQFFTVEYRQPQGFFDATLCQNVSYCNADKGGLIYFGGMTISGTGGGSDSHLLDTTAGTHMGLSGWWPDRTDVHDGALEPGQVFTDPDYGINIKAISADSAGLTVDVTLAQECVRAVPAVNAASPSLQTASAGQSKTFTFTVTNKDAGDCGAVQYRYAPPGFANTDPFKSREITAVANPSYFTLSPGASQTVTLTVGSNSTTPDGDYMNAFSYGMGSIHQSTFMSGVSGIPVTGGVYRVASGADTTPPTQPGAPTVTVMGAASAQINWNPSSDNTRLFGYKLTVNNSSVYLVKDTAILFTSLLPSTNYTVNIVAVDTKMKESTTATVTFTTKAKTDTVPPNAINNLRVKATDHDYTLSWQKPNDNVGVVSYDAPYCLPLSTCQKSERTVTQRSANQRYEDVYVYAYDADGNALTFYYVPKVTFYTAMPGDGVAPSQPEQLRIVSSSRDISKGTTIAWNPSVDDKGIAGYNVYSGAVQIGYTTATTYAAPLIVGQGVYRVQAVDVSGSKSAFSNTFSTGFGGSVGTDTNPPTNVNFTSPNNNAVLSGTVTLKATASDDVGVAGIQYFMDGESLGLPSRTAPYDFTLDTTKFADGTHWLIATAGDKPGNVASSAPLTITINNNNTDVVAPTVAFTSPAPEATISGVVNVAATANDAVGITKVEFLVDGVVAAVDATSPFSFAWDTMQVTNGTHTLSAKAYDAAGNVGTTAITVQVQNSDTTPPSTPTSVSATAVTATRIDLTWQASTDNVGVTGYYVVRDGVTIAQTSGTTFSDNSVTGNTSYNYRVMAYDAAGNVSSLSVAQSVTTPNPPDTIAPTQPGNLVASAVSSSQINLSWTASTDNIGVSAYDIYRNGAKIATTTTVSYGDGGLNAATAYTYHVIARDAAGNLSPASATVSATTQPASSTGVVQGTLTGSDGVVLAGATVSVAWDGATHKYTTSKSGQYVISAIPTGTYQITYSRKGYTTKTVGVTVQSGVTTTQNIILTKKGRK